MTVDPVFAETVTRLFGQTCDFETVQRAEQSGWAGSIWEPFVESGFAWVSIPEACGGSGGDLVDALEMLRLVGFHAAPIPAAETGMLAGWLLAQAGLPIPNGVTTVTQPNASRSLRVRPSAGGFVVTGQAHGVPWARHADQIAHLFDLDGQAMVAALSAEQLRIEPNANLAGEPRDTITAHDVVLSNDAVAPAADGVDGDALMARGALSRAMMMAGSLEAMTQLTVGYTRDRKQFGRPIASFQAVAQHLVWGAQEAAVVRMAAERASAACAAGPAGFEIASAKLVANRSAKLAVAAAHQAHGAMGMTQEYQLHHFSRRLLAWRTEYGNERYWSTQLGTTVRAAGADALYPIITGGTKELHR